MLIVIINKTVFEYPLKIVILILLFISFIFSFMFFIFITNHKSSDLSKFYFVLYGCLNHYWIKALKGQDDTDFTQH